MPKKIILYPELEKSVTNFSYENITEQRKEVLKPLIAFIQEKAANLEEIRLNLICTHNSNVFCYSGGTEATAMFPLVGEILKQAGFKLQVLSTGNNPVYAVKYSENQHPVIAFSKTYYDEFNPEEGFAAIMTCSQADGGCPFIAGAEKRIAITYEDPKEFDNLPQQTEKYKERSIQIAEEMFYVFSQIKKG